VAPQALAEVEALIGPGPWRHDLLIEYLHLINDRYRQLGAPHMAALAKLLGLAQTEVYEVATFYHHFDVVKENPDGSLPAAAALTVRVCDGLSCEMGGAKQLLEKLPALLGRDVRVIPAPCVGRCEQAPVAIVHQKPVPRASLEAVRAEVQAGQITDSPGNYIDFDAYSKEGGYSLLRDCMEHRRDLESVLKTMEDSGLRGLGGAGFPTGRKWRIVRGEAAPRLMAVNIDEGEPGTFKDRVYLERDPHRFLEGMLIAAWAVGISAIYIYLRDEYHGCRALLEKELAKLTDNPPVPLPKIELRRGAGAYICGEESAMIESIEGKRGMPRLRPPYVAQVGLFGRPTLEHNFETLFWVRELLEKGAAWFASQGRNGRKGLRSFSVSGRVKNPGVKLAPAGITARQLIDEFCGGMQEGHIFYGYLPGGASGGILPASMGDIPLDFDTLQPYGCFIGSAAVIVLSSQDTAKAAARNMMRFFEHESCGQCTPCRVGTAKTNALIAKDNWDQPLLAELSQVMRDASICGLGQAAPNPVDTVIKYFPNELT
jgi:formate dehydrogenase beta subunit